MSRDWDVIVLTQREYLNPESPDSYVSNILLEDQLVLDALRQVGLKADRKSWDDPDFDWSNTRFVLFRTIWDYFHRFNEFQAWLTSIEHRTKTINDLGLVRWNMHKGYLKELEQKGVAIPPTILVRQGDTSALMDLVESTNWKEVVIKPAVSGAGRHTYRVQRGSANEYNQIFEQLLAEEDMLLQEYQPSITTLGEIALMVIGGVFKHAVIKKAKAGEFRVQDDFGGSVYPYDPSEYEINLAEEIVAKCSRLPAYARVDLFWDQKGNHILGELELIEPEMWFREKRSSARDLAEYIKQVHFLSL